MSEALVALQDVTKIYPSGTRALDPVDLVVREGELLTLLGPSGCGKSTLLRLIAGLERPSSGAVWRPGEIGFVFQEATLMPWADVAANVSLPLRLQNVPEGELRRRRDEALALVGLEPFAKAFPRELSGGMRMRVSIARALVSRPKLLLMDEPFAAIDEIGRFRLNDDLLRLKAELATTIVFVTHSVYEAVYLATRIAVMAARPGRIVADVAIDQSFRRAPDARTSAAYLETYSRVSGLLAQAAEAAP
ncbi:ABC transporter ATP-binding protein [Methylovirgula ligni]|uniref:NitT/TauT family transport system ATP-binding protein n=1 Tax=Methylovirgula ligni TaxID=569860 RepID=A0A3D9YXL2_9HYPH|nr:ABC transporter ATP-binding protein [Methylovirgula ligni]QAY94723.1 ABC transporter ATP-binding protein [Methylovirgula ligni]REF87387.1 NitT/TauT family transport system ATP-binding protein [Methylovirgula ligni]